MQMPSQHSRDVNVVAAGCTDSQQILAFVYCIAKHSYHAHIHGDL